MEKKKNLVLYLIYLNIISVLEIKIHSECIQCDYNMPYNTLVLLGKIYIFSSPNKDGLVKNIKKI